MKRGRSEVVSTYAHALALAFAKAEGIERSFEPVESLQQILTTHPRLCKLLEAPHIEASRKESLVMNVLAPSLPSTLTYFLKLIIRRGRSHRLMEILEAYRPAAERQLGHLCGVAKTASPLTDPEKKRITHVLSTRLGTPVFLEFTTDKRLLGGVRIEVGDYLFDASVKGRLQALERKLSG